MSACHRRDFLARLRCRSTRRGKCWIINGYKNHNGYGFIHFQGKRTRAHRAVWIYFNGPIPDGLLVCHTCDTPGCVNPDCLFLGTHDDNAQDKMNKGRYVPRPADVVMPAHESHWNAKLTQSDVDRIRAIPAGEYCASDLAAEFGITTRSMRKIRNGERWK